MLKENEKNPGGQSEHKFYLSQDVTGRTKLSDICINKNHNILCKKG